MTTPSRLAMGERVRRGMGVTARRTLLIGLLVAGAFGAGRISAGRRPDGAERPSPDPAPAAATAAVAARSRPVQPLPISVGPPPAPGAAADMDPNREQARVDRAGFLLDRVFEQLKRMSAREELPSAEAQATAVESYLTGLLEGAVDSDPGMRSAFGASLRSRLCGDRAPSDAEAISLARMVTVLPDVATAESLDCFFAKAKENVPLWSMLDAWRSSGLPKTAALARLEASAQDARTVRRLGDPEKQARRWASGP